MAGIKTGRPPEAQHAEAIHSSDEKNMAEPDDLYPLRAQFWLGHYDMVRSLCFVWGRLRLCGGIRTIWVAKDWHMLCWCSGPDFMCRSIEEEGGRSREICVYRGYISQYGVDEMPTRGVGALEAPLVMMIL